MLADLPGSFLTRPNALANQLIILDFTLRVARFAPARAPDDRSWTYPRLFWWMHRVRPTAIHGIRCIPSICLVRGCDAGASSESPLGEILNPAQPFSYQTYFLLFLPA